MLLSLTIDLLVVSDLACSTCMCGWLGFGFFLNYFPFRLFILTCEVSHLDSYLSHSLPHSPGREGVSG